jgi:phosphatidylcholine synthase
VSVHDGQSDGHSGPGRGATVPGARALAFGVHVFTATGAALGLLALEAAVRLDYTMMFLWLGIALFVDGIDGTLARRLDVARRLPRWSGEALDLVVDFVTYVLVPAYVLMQGGLLPSGWATLAALIVVITSALYFADGEMKTTDNYFKGFPAVWNTVLFYLLLNDPGPWVALVTVLALAALTFAPVIFVHPFRVARFRELTVALLVLWAVLAVFAMHAGMDPAGWIVWGLNGIGAYFLLFGVVRGFRKT